jgi:hypothetical protein
MRKTAVLGSLTLGFHGRAQGDAVEPTGQRLSFPNRGRLPGQHQKGRLRGILGVLFVMEDKAADSQDQRPMPTHQSLKGDFITPCDKSAEQIAVGQLIRVARGG